MNGGLSFFVGLSPLPSPHDSWNQLQQMLQPWGQEEAGREDGLMSVYFLSLLWSSSNVLRQLINFNSHNCWIHPPLVNNRRLAVCLKAQRQSYGEVQVGLGHGKNKVWWILWHRGVHALLKQHSSGFRGNIERVWSDPVKAWTTIQLRLGFKTTVHQHSQSHASQVEQFGCGNGKHPSDDLWQTCGKFWKWSPQNLALTKAPS